MKRVINFNEDLAVIHAYLCADGYLCKRSKKNRWWKLGLRNTNLVLLKDYQKRVKRYFGHKPGITDGRCSFTDKSAWLFMVKNFKSFHSYEWTFPKQIPIKHHNIWLRAFFDCESWVAKRKAKNRSVALECVNRKGILKIQEALKKLNIDSIVKKRHTRQVFSLKIYGKINILRFKQKIGFLHPDKKAALNEAINSFVNYNWKFPIKKRKLKEFIKEKMVEKVNVEKSGTIRFCSNTRNNLLTLSKNLEKLYGVESKVSNLKYNGIGTKYYEFSINKKAEIKKVLDNDLISENQKDKIKTLF